MSISTILGNYILEIFLTLIVIIWIVQKRRNKRFNLPPGPSGVPILGYLPFINVQTIHHDLIDISRKYGSKVIYFKLGRDNVVILNGYDTIKETLSREDMQNRPKHFILNYFSTFGQLTTWNGKLWKNQRGFTLRSLRNLGFGKSKFEGKIHEELKYMTDKIDEANKKSVGAKSEAPPIRIVSFLGPAISNTIGMMTLGLRHEYDHEIRKNMDAVFISDQTSVGFSFFSWTSYFPEILGLIFLLPTPSAKRLKFFFTYVVDYISSVIMEKKRAIDSMDSVELAEESDNFADVYLKRLKEIESIGAIDEKDSFNLDHLMGNVQAIFGAGSATTKDMIEWFLALMAIHQDVQEKMYQEIMRVIGADRLVSLTDKNELPITESIIYETLRFASMIPINLPHVASKDVKIAGYDVPKDTIIMANIYAVHMDADHWERPEEFNHARFLSADGSKFIRDDHMIAFGYGRRSCPGESMAILEILIFAVTLIQKYHVTGDGNSIIVPNINGIARVAHPQLKIKFKPR